MVFFLAHTVSTVISCLPKMIDFLIKVGNNLLSLIEFYIL